MFPHYSHIDLPYLDITCLELRNMIHKRALSRYTSTPLFIGRDTRNTRSAAPRCTGITSQQCPQLEPRSRTLSSPRLSGFFTSLQSAATLKPAFRCGGAIAGPAPPAGASPPPGAASLPPAAAEPAAAAPDASPEAVPPCCEVLAGCSAAATLPPPRSAAHTASTLALCCELRSSARAPACCLAAFPFFGFFAAAASTHPRWECHTLRCRDALW